MWKTQTCSQQVSWETSKTVITEADPHSSLCTSFFFTLSMSCHHFFSFFHRSCVIRSLSGLACQSFSSCPPSSPANTCPSLVSPHARVLLRNFSLSQWLQFDLIQAFYVVSAWVSRADHAQFKQEKLCKIIISCYRIKQHNHLFFQYRLINFTSDEHRINAHTAECFIWQTGVNITDI